MTRRLGLRGRTMLVFALVFAGFSIAAASANYLLLRRAIDNNQGLPTVEELSQALEDVAAANDQQLPGVITEGSGTQVILTPDDSAQSDGSATSAIADDFFPLVSRNLEDGEPAVVAIDAWISDRIQRDGGGGLIEFESDTLPADGAAFDEVVLGSLAVFEPRSPGVTSDFLDFLAGLRGEDSAPLFDGPIAGDGDICRSVFSNCEEALAELNELMRLSEDTEFVNLVNESFALANERSRDRALASQLRISGLVALLSTIGAAIAAWFVTNRMLRPVAEVTAVAREASADNLGRRINLGGPSDELKQLADTFDDMLVRLQRSFQSSQRFTSNAAHELKTPLAVIRAEIDAHRADPAIGDEEVLLLDRLEAAADRSDRLVGALLDLARAEGKPPLEDDVYLTTIVTDTLLDSAKLLSDRQLTVDYRIGDANGDDLTPAAVVLGDQALITTMAQNLLGNAVKYALSGSEILVAIEHVGDRVRLRVENQSEPIEVEDPAELIEPFNRASSRTAASGHGLGLSIVGAVARAHNAEITVDFCDGNSGLAVTVDFVSPGSRPNLALTAGAL